MPSLSDLSSTSSSDDDELSTTITTSSDDDDDTTSSSSGGEDDGDSSSASSSSSSSSGDDDDDAPPVLPPPKPQDDKPLFPTGRPPRDDDYFAHFKTMPRGKHRTLDLFRFATEMFFSSLNSEIQIQRARKSGAAAGADFRYTWKNSGPVAENFAVVCDQAKLLHGQIRNELPAHVAPKFGPFVSSMLEYLHKTSRVTEKTLPLKTYGIKFKDWEKGGTRYNADATSAVKSNVQFASAEQRAKKLDQYVEHVVKVSAQRGNRNTNGGANSDDATDNADGTRKGGGGGGGAASKAPVAPTLTASAVKIVYSNNTSASGAAAAGGGGGGTVLVPVPVTLPSSVPLNVKSLPAAPSVFGGSLPASARGGGAGAVATLAAAAKYPGDVPLRAKVTELIGGHTAYPPPLRDRLPEYVAVCEHIEDPQYRIQLLGWIAKSSRSVHQSFERLGGLAHARRWLDDLLNTQAFVVPPASDDGDAADATAAKKAAATAQQQQQKPLKPPQEKETLAVQMIEKLTHFQCICSDSTRAVWSAAPPSLAQPPAPAPAQSKDAAAPPPPLPLDWLRRALGIDIAPEKAPYRCKLLTEFESVLSRSAMTLLAQKQSGQRRDPQLYSQQGGGQQQFTSAVPNNSAAARQHEMYTERRLQLALELRMASVAASRCSSTGSAHQQSSSSLSRSDGGVDAAREKFDEVFRAMPTPVGENGTNGMLYASSAASSAGFCVVAEKVDPIRLLSLSV